MAALWWLMWTKRVHANTSCSSDWLWKCVLIKIRPLSQFILSLSWFWLWRLHKLRPMMILPRLSSESEIPRAWSRAQNGCDLSSSHGHLAEIREEIPFTRLFLGPHSCDEDIWVLKVVTLHVPYPTQGSSNQDHRRPSELMAMMAPSAPPRCKQGGTACSQVCSFITHHQ